jgi:hypothetical protein
MTEHDKHRSLTEDELEAIADRVFEKMQAHIGRSAVKVVVWLIATGTAAVLAWIFSTHKP